MSNSIIKRKKIEKDEGLIKIKYRLEDRLNKYKDTPDEIPIGGETSIYHRVKRLEIAK